ncbi:MAG TPA: PEP-CTERM sorting domain-containing protein, partial [Verrucomicrobiota bacterium]|nr:PEP-CTERM sorting domain-containing protein [Verrucomicrobiota bacterium]HQB17715.1 PEP-CTERM sorting domain-containing protein [Verrucomicrobiota bacterium]
FASIAIALSSGESSDWPGSPGARGFIGIGFELDDGFHYGYFDVHMVAEGGGVLFGWAYNSIPNAPIFASPVPEPSTWALLIGGGVLMLWFRRKGNERRG